MDACHSYTTSIELTFKNSSEDEVLANFSLNSMATSRANIPVKNYDDRSWYISCTPAKEADEFKLGFCIKSKTTNVYREYVLSLDHEVGIEEYDDGSYDIKVRLCLLHVCNIRL